MRIHIIGGPGSGKTYAAKKLSSLLKIECYDLDEVFWHKDDVDFSKVASDKQRDAKLKKIAKSKSWIVEGSFTNDWVSPIMKNADIVIIINPNKWIRAFRIIKRTLKRYITKSKKESLRNLIKFLKWNHQYDGRNLLRGEKLIKKLKKTVIYFNKADKAIEYLTK